MLSEDNPHNLEQLIRLPGQQWDKETGLHYNRHRYYDPLQGRYITQDPIGLYGGMNAYWYPLNPVQWIDPRGLNPFGSWLSQPGIQDAYNRAAAEYENSIKPILEWRFKKWDESRGKAFFSIYINFNAICEDQFGNTKSVNARTFQTGLFSINEIEAGRGIPDPSQGLPGKGVAAINTILDGVSNLNDARKRAIACGSKSGYQCFKVIEETLEPGKKLCGQR